MGAIRTGWQVVDGDVSAWFSARSLTQAAQFAGRVVELSPRALIDVRSSGVRVRLSSRDHVVGVSELALEMGIDADSSQLQQLAIRVDSANPAAVQSFWAAVLDYQSVGEMGLADPLRRDPAIRIHRSEHSRPLRGRIHLDVVRPADAVEQVGLGDGSGPYGVCHADIDGNEVDVLAGDPLGEGEAVSDWQLVWGAVACYGVTSPAQQRELVAAAASAADRVGFPLMIDLRPGIVILDTGKDQADGDAHGLDLEFTDLAAVLQRDARRLGATVDPALPRLVQVFLDVTNIAAAQAFWCAALGYVHDRRDGVSDIYDPRRLGPVVVFQTIDSSDSERLRQPARMRLELAVPADCAPARLERMLAAGGTLLGEAADGIRVGDPDANEVVIVHA